MRVSNSTTITFDGMSCTVGELMGVLKQHNNQDTVRFSYHKGYNQMDSEYLSASVVAEGS